MKRFILAIFLSLAVTSAHAQGWECSASSPSGYGYGYSTISRADACQKAIADCQSKSARGHTCTAN